MTDAERSEIERLRGDYAKLHGVVETYINAPGQIKGEAFRDVCGTMEYLAGRDDALGWAGCWQRQKVEIERLRNENEKYRAGMQENCRLRQEIERLRKQRQDEITEFNAGWDAAANGTPIDNDPGPPEDNWRNGWCAFNGDKQAKEIERLRAIVTQLPLGVPIGLNDRHGNPIHVGDKLRFTGQEWDGPLEFVVSLAWGKIQHPGCTSYLENWCEIIESWSVRATHDERRVDG